MTVNVEIAKCKGGHGRIDVRFGYSKQYVDAMKTIPGRSYVGTIGDKHWHVPLDMESCRALRRAFGDDLKIGTELRGWAEGAKRDETKMTSIALSTEGHLEALWSKLPKLAEAIHLGPLGKHMTDQERADALQKPGSYQAADVNFWCASQAPLVGNEQGTGKTPTYIAAVWEAGLEKGNHLVIAPKSAVGGTWLGELTNWQSDSSDVEVFVCVDNRQSKEATLAEFRASTAPVKWLVVNPAMITWVKDPDGPFTIPVKGRQRGCTCKASKTEHVHYAAPYPELLTVPWKTVCIDEAHKGNVRNHRTITAKAMKHIRGFGKVTVMTGTPMKKTGGSDIWGILNYLRPDIFTSYWRLVDQFFEVEDNGYGKKVGELLKEMEDSFWATLAPYVIRRLKKEVAPWLPEKLYVPVDCWMDAAQQKQYNGALDGFIEIAGDDEEAFIETKGVLDQFTRLRQFANAQWKINGAGELEPVASCKLEALVENIEASGTLDGNGKKHLVFSLSRKLTMWYAAKLREMGLKVDVIHGGINKDADRRQIMKNFQEGDTDVLCIVTTAGGVSLTLDAADDVHLMDEAWSHDEDEQAEDRAHRVSRIHQVTVYVYRTVGSIDQYVAETKMAKKDQHELILDIRRKILADRLKVAS